MTNKPFGGEEKSWLVNFLKVHKEGGGKQVRVRGVDGEGRPINHLYTMQERKPKGHKQGSTYANCVKLCRQFARDCVDNLNERLDDLGKLGPTKLFRAGKWPKIKARREKKCKEWLHGCSRLFRHKLPRFDLKAVERELPTFCAIMELHHEMESFAQGLNNFIGSVDSKRPAFCAHRVPVARDQRAEGRPRVGAYAVSADGDAGQRERDRGDSGHGSDERRAVGEFRSPEGRGRRRDERGRWRGLERFNADRAREAAHGEEPWETSSEEEAEEAGAHLERAAEDADGGDDKEEPVTGIGNAKPGAAEVVGSASQVGGSQSGRREWRERDASHQEEQSAEGLRRQERREWGVRVGATSSGTQGERSRSDMGGLRVAREEPRQWERQPVNPRALDGRRAQKGGVGDGALSLGRQVTRKEGEEDEPRASSHYWRRGEGHEEGPSSAERRGQRQEERSRVAWIAGPREQWERRTGREFRSPLGKRQRGREDGGDARVFVDWRRQERGAAWSPSPERWRQQETSAA
ncbi:unnamed protein product [Closterium sp. NIES-64]|nr:unnamed protein product [Closterium sp. NIES-64]